MIKAKVFASTELGHVAKKEEFDKIGGLTAGVCYLPDTMEKLFDEPTEKTQKRTGMIKGSGHHSPFDHASVTLELDNLPKIAAMALNNEKMYTTSEKSARYKRMALPESEQVYYDKWLDIFQKLIADEYQAKYPNYFSDIKITKLAQENARYLTSVFTPTSMAYTVSYRQLNVLHGLIDKEIVILKNENTLFAVKLASSLEDLNNALKGLGYYDENLADNKKNRGLSLTHRGRPLVEQFGDSYTTSYLGSFAELAQAHRHRTLNYSMEMLEDPQFFVPPILENHSELVKEWWKDCMALADHFPQGMLVKINERGTLEDFILKTKERMCSAAQLEINRQTIATGKKMLNALKQQGHPGAEELEPYTKGSRCTFPDYKCDQPCGFKEGITGERLI